MKKLTLGALQNSRLPKTLGMCSTSTDFTDIVNEAHRRLLERGTWHGTVVEYHVCTTADGCLTLPRQVASVLAASVNDEPIKLRNHWFEYLEGGYGNRNACNSSELQVFDRGMAVAFDDIYDKEGTVLQVYTTEVEDASARILLQGYDENGNWITSDDSGTIIDGEYVDLETSAQTTTQNFSALTGVIKPVTLGEVYIQRRSTTHGTAVIGYYERDETTPEYRRIQIPGLGDQPNYNCTGGDTLTNRRSVKLMVKLAHIDVSGTNDWLVIRNEGALKYACRAVQHEEANRDDKAFQAWSAAEEILSKELEHYQGVGNVEPLRLEPDTWGAGAIDNVI